MKTCRVCRLLTLVVWAFGTVLPSSEKEADVETDQHRQVRVFLGDGRVVEGKITFRAPVTVTVRHKKDDIIYEKTVNLNDVRLLEFRQWKGTPGKTRAGGRIFQFDVSKFSLVLSDDTLLSQESDVFAFWKQVVLENRYGRVNLFSYWMDLRKEDGSWHTGMSGPSNGFRVVCHGDVIKKIEFLANEK